MFKKVIFGLVLLFSSLFSDVSLGVIGNHGYIEFDSVSEFSANQGKNWVAVYKKGDSTDWGNVLRWAWVKDLPSHGEKTYDFEFDDLESGKVYELRFFYDNSYDIAQSVDFTFGSSKPFLQIVKYDNNSLSLLSSNIDLNTNSWVGVYEKGKSNDWDNVIGWSWVDSTTSNDKDYRSTISDLTLADGLYDVRLFYNNSFDLEASVELVVDNANGDTPKVFDAVSKSGDRVVKVRFENAPGNKKDWIGVFKKGADRVEKNVLGWAYLNGEKSGQVDVEVDTLYVGVGKYDLVMFGDDSYDVIGEGSLERESRVINQISLGDYIEDIKISKDETKLYTIQENIGLKIFDISNPKNIKIISSMKLSDPKSMVLSKDETKIYIAEGLRGLAVVDISNKLKPKLLSYHKNDYAHFGFVKILLSPNGKTAYLRDTYRYLSAFNISNPYNVKAIVVPKHQVGQFYISHKTNKLYYIDDNEAGYLHIVDISDPYNWNSITKIEFGYKSFYFSDDETKLYSKTHSQLKIWDISDGENLNTISYLDILKDYGSFNSSQDKRLYFDNHQNKVLSIINIENPKNPKLVTYIPSTFYDKVIVSKDGKKLYTTSYHTVKIIDLVGLD